MICVYVLLDSDYFIDDGRSDDTLVVISSIGCRDEFSMSGFYDCTITLDSSTVCPTGNDLYVYCERGGRYIYI